LFLLCKCYRLSELQDKPTVNTQQKQKLEEIIAALRNDQQAMESQISVVEAKTKVSEERIQELTQQIKAFDDSLLQDTNVEYFYRCRCKLDHDGFCT